MIMGKWILCANKLPEEYTICLICDDRGHRTIGAYIFGEWFMQARIDNPIAWMILPKPYGWSF